MAMLVGFNESEGNYMAKFIAELKSGNRTALAWMLEAYRRQDPYVRICPAPKLKIEQDMLRRFNRVNPDILAACLDVFIEQYPHRWRSHLEHQMWHWHVRALREGWLDLVGALWLAHSISQQGITALGHVNLTAQEYGRNMLEWAGRHPAIRLPENGLKGLVEDSPSKTSRATKKAALDVKNVLALEVWKLAPAT